MEQIKKGRLDLTTVDGNAFAIIGAVRRALTKAGNEPAAVAAVIADMTSGNYDHLVAVAASVTEEP
jgi:hypothetical protein